MLSKEQKGCKWKKRGTKNELLSDKAILWNSKRKKTNVNVAWVNFRKAYDTVPQSWILETLELVGLATNIRELL